MTYHQVKPLFFQQVLLFSNYHQDQLTRNTQSYHKMPVRETSAAKQDQRECNLPQEKKRSKKSINCCESCIDDKKIQYLIRVQSSMLVKPHIILRVREGKGGHVISHHLEESSSSQHLLQSLPRVAEGKPLKAC